MIAKRAAWFALLMLCLGLAGEAHAQAYPSRPITLIVPFPAGGPTDTLARVLADRLKTALGQPIIIENVSGAGGSLGVGRAARAAPDGYTLSIGHVQTHVINGAVYKLPYDVINDFEPISLIADTPQWIVGKSSLPPKDIAELIAWMKERPGKGTVGSVGVGGPPDLAAISFQKQTGTSFQLVPYRGGAPQLRPYAVLSGKRWWAAPDVPTLSEAGVPGLSLSFWHGLWVPKGTPKDVLARLDAAVHESLADATLRQRFSDIGQEIWPLEMQTPQALRALQQAEAEKWWPVVKAANIKGE
jgi:tripartite-type tricarboxylate transporter receptor subunit TctC